MKNKSFFKLFLILINKNIIFTFDEKNKALENLLILTYSKKLKKKEKIEKKQIILNEINYDINPLELYEDLKKKGKEIMELQEISFNLFIHFHESFQIKTIEEITQYNILKEIKNTEHNEKSFSTLKKIKEICKKKENIKDGENINMKNFFTIINNIMIDDDINQDEKLKILNESKIIIEHIISQYNQCIYCLKILNENQIEEEEKVRILILDIINSIHNKFTFFKEKDEQIYFEKKKDINKNILELIEIQANKRNINEDKKVEIKKIINNFNILLDHPLGKKIFFFKKIRFQDVTIENNIPKNKNTVTIIRFDTKNMFFIEILVKCIKEIYEKCNFKEMKCLDSFLDKHIFFKKEKNNLQDKKITEEIKIKIDKKMEELKKQIELNNQKKIK